MSAVHLSLVGMGSGDPAHVTPQGAAALADADLILIPRKGADKADLADRRLALVPQGTAVAEFDMPKRDDADGYLPGVHAWHDAIAHAWQQAIAARLPQGGHVALMIWGDPSLYDSALRVAARLGLPTDVIPGISSLHLLTAAHGIALTGVAGETLITTGRRLRDRGWPGVETAVVFLDGGCAFQTLDVPDLHIWWGAYLGMPEEILMAGPVAEIGAEIVARRAGARAAHGWIMDTYLLRVGQTA